MNHTHEMNGAVALAMELDDSEPKAQLPGGWFWVDGKTARHPYLGEIHRLPTGWFAYPPHTRTWQGFGPALIAMIGAFGAAVMPSVSVSQFAASTAIACSVLGAGGLIFTAIVARRDISAWRAHRELLSAKPAARSDR